MLTNIKQLTTEEGRREYYKYFLDDPSSFRHHVEPYLDPRFNDELKETYGCDHHGDPRFRIIWAGTEPMTAFKDTGSETIEYLGKKYPWMRLRIVKGYTYTNDDGQKVHVTTIPQVPKDKIYTEDITWDDLGVMKFAIEAKYTAEEMVQMGWYPPFDSPEFDMYCVKNGKRYRSRPNPKGEYILAHYIETEKGEYRDVTQADIDRIHEIVARSRNESEEEYLARKMKQREDLARLEQENESYNYSAQFEKSRIAAEKKLAKGQIIYG
jgi:hypothetical protein